MNGRIKLTYTVNTPGRIGGEAGPTLSLLLYLRDRVAKLRSLNVMP